MSATGIDLIVKQLLDVRGGFHGLKINEQSFRKYRMQFKNGVLSHEHKQQIARLGGYELAQQELWIKKFSV